MVFLLPLSRWAFWVNILKTIDFFYCVHINHLTKISGVHTGEILISSIKFRNRLSKK